MVLIASVVALAAMEMSLALATGGNCSPLPQVADSLRFVVPLASSSPAPTSVEVIVAVKPPAEDLAISHVFSAEAQVGASRTQVWLTEPAPVVDLTRLKPLLQPAERAWTFRVIGAPPHAVVTIFASHYLYGATDDPKPATCRMVKQRSIGSYTTL
jgi:hypothetical protein